MAKRKSEAGQIPIPVEGMEAKAETAATKKRRARKPPDDLVTLNEAIVELNESLSKMAAMIERLSNGDKKQDELLLKVFAQHAESASRLGRLLRDRRALSGEAADGFLAALGQALDEAQTLVGRDDL